MKRLRAFTLVEILMVIFIIAIAITITILYLNPERVLQEKSEVTLIKLERLLDHLRFKAINDNQPIALMVANKALSVKVWDPVRLWQSLNQNKLVQRFAFSQITDLQLSNPVIFYTDGQITSFDLRFKIQAINYRCLLQGVSFQCGAAS